MVEEEGEAGWACVEDGAVRSETAPVAVGLFLLRDERNDLPLNIHQSMLTQEGGTQTKKNKKKKKEQ